MTTEQPGPEQIYENPVIGWRVSNPSPAARRNVRISRLIKSGRRQRLAALAVCRWAVENARLSDGDARTLRAALDSATIRYGARGRADYGDAGRKTVVEIGNRAAAAVRALWTLEKSAAELPLINAVRIATNPKNGPGSGASYYARAIEFAKRAAVAFGVDGAERAVRTIVLAFADGWEFEPRWRTGAAAGLALTADRDGPAILPILADALSDAGYPDGPVLDYLRFYPVAVRGVRVIDELLDRPADPEPAKRAATSVPEPFRSAGFVRLSAGCLEYPDQTLPDETQIIVRVYRNEPGGNGGSFAGGAVRGDCSATVRWLYPGWRDNIGLEVANRTRDAIYQPQSPAQLIATLRGVRAIP